MGKLFILIAEDDIADGHYALSALQKTNKFNKIVLVNNAQEAITYLSKSDQLPDIILSDLMMPKYNGFDLYKKLKKIDRFANIPFVIYTDILSDSDMVNASELGIDVLQKPLDISEYSILCNTLSNYANSYLGIS
mgnify:CR=1 FL=1